MRDRLIEILDKTIAIKDENTDDYNEWLADELLANGVIVPPFKLGDRVYRIVEMSTGIRHKINRFHTGQFETGTMIPCDPTIKKFIRCVTVTKNNIYDGCEKFGKTVFLTKEEAEQALKERGRQA